MCIRDSADPPNTVSPSMLASTPAQTLNPIRSRRGIPRFSLFGKCSKPRIVVARSPYNMRHDPARFQSLPHVSQSCHRVGEKHRSKTRKDEIILGLEVVKQRIAIDERNILQAQLCSVLSAVL